MGMTDSPLSYKPSTQALQCLQALWFSSSLFSPCHSTFWTLSLFPWPCRQAAPQHSSWGTSSTGKLPLAKKMTLRGLKEISGNQLRSPRQIISKIKIELWSISAFHYIPKQLIFFLGFIPAAFKMLTCNFQIRRKWGGREVTTEPFAQKDRFLPAKSLHPTLLQAGAPNPHPRGTCSRSERSWNGPKTF